MSYKNITELRKSVLHCPRTECPFRNTHKGHYPKPPRGPITAEVMMIFENPGSPEGKNLKKEDNPECQWDINTITLKEARQLSIRGQTNWLFDTCRLDRNIWSKHNMVIGETVYTTDTHKCPNPKGGKAKQKKTAFRICIEYLQEEIRLVKPKVIFAFGDYARRAVKHIEGVRWVDEKNGKELIIKKSGARQERLYHTDQRLYVLMPHPSGFWQNPPMTITDYNEALEYAFAKASDWVNRPAKQL